ncbi:hypothetical protein ACFE04_027227 [Oxalis oulophora]
MNHQVLVDTSIHSSVTNYNCTMDECRAKLINMQMLPTRKFHQRHEPPSFCRHEHSLLCYKLQLYHGQMQGQTHCKSKQWCTFSYYLTKGNQGEWYQHRRTVMIHRATFAKKALVGPLLAACQDTKIPSSTTE